LTTNAQTSTEPLPQSTVTAVEETPCPDVPTADVVAATQLLTIILPIHNEKDNLRPLLDEIEAALASHAGGYEVIAVDDGSRDGSTQLLKELAAEKRYLRVIFFRQNFGQAAAFDAGFRHASGDIVVTLDADGQNDPQDIPRLVKQLDEGYDFVSGIRANRRDGWLLRRVPSRVANFIIRRVTGTKIRDLGCSLKVYRREITDELRLYGEMHRFIPVLVESIGARTGEMPVNHRPRIRGTSKYGMTRTLKVLLDLTTVWFMRGYQTKPIYIFGGIGFLLLILSALTAAYVLYEKFAWGVWVHRNPLFLMCMMFSIVGVHFMLMGLIAEIQIRTYFESQKKSTYSISSTIGLRCKQS
jgi:glycosyltransferase involved in cell wall biosynthesis